MLKQLEDDNLMPNTFKLKTNTNMPSSAGSPDALYTVPSATQTIIVGLVLCNLDTSSRTVSVFIDRSSSEDVFLLKNVPIVAGSSLEVLSGGKVVLEATDVLQIDCDVADKIGASLSILEIS